MWEPGHQQCQWWFRRGANLRDLEGSSTESARQRRDRVRGCAHWDGDGGRQVWVQEDGEVETNIWEHERSETIIFKGHNSEATTKFSIYRSIILSTFLRQYSYSLFLLFRNFCFIFSFYFIKVGALLTGRKSHVFSQTVCWQLWAGSVGRACSPPWGVTANLCGHLHLHSDKVPGDRRQEH